MKKYKLILSNGQNEVTFGSPYGNTTFKNGEVVPESAFVKLYPNYFFPIPEVAKSSTLSDVMLGKVTPVIVEEPTAESIQKIVQLDTKISQNTTTTVKRKPGRPPKNTFKKG